MQELAEKFELLNEKLSPSSTFRLLFKDAPGNKFTMQEIIGSLKDFFVINEK